MESGEPRKQLLTLIRDFATEKSQGERRVTDLKKRLLELQVDFDAANADLEAAKRSKEVAEQELRGFQVQLSMTDASILAQEARISLLQGEISKVGSDLAALKNEDGIQRDDFISTMYEFNRKIRQFHETTHGFQNQHFPDFPSDNASQQIKGGLLDVKDTLEGLEDKITSTNAQMHKLEGEYKKELHDHEQVSQDLADVERRASLVESVMQEMSQLQEIAWQTSELEKSYASLGEELKRRYTCPSCQSNNMGELEATFETGHN